MQPKVWFFVSCCVSVSDASNHDAVFEEEKQDHGVSEDVETSNEFKPAIDPSAEDEKFDQVVLGRLLFFIIIWRKENEKWEKK